MYDFEVDRVVGELRRRGCKRILLQLPDGLRPHAFELSRALASGAGVEVILSGDSCYGACDVATRQAEDLGVDLLVHYGHSPMVETGSQILYVEARVPIQVDGLVEAALPLIEAWRRVGLVTNVQHAHQLGEVAEALRRAGKEVAIGKGGGRTPLDGQVLGCSFQAAVTLPVDVDGFLFIGGGRFHPLGVSLCSGKPVVIANPFSGSVSLLGDAELMQVAKRRMAAITFARSAKRVGVLVSSKPGQRTLNGALLAVDKLQGRGVEAFLIYLDEVKESTLNNFSEVDAFVDTACPRIALDGVAGVERPILTLPELSVALGEQTWEEVWGSGLLL